MPAICVRDTAPAVFVHRATAVLTALGSARTSLLGAAFTLCCSTLHFSPGAAQPSHESLWAQEGGAERRRGGACARRRGARVRAAPPDDCLAGGAAGDAVEAPGLPAEAADGAGGAGGGAQQEGRQAGCVSVRPRVRVAAPCRCLGCSARAACGRRRCWFGLCATTAGVRAHAAAARPARSTPPPPLPPVTPPLHSRPRQHPPSPTTQARSCCSSARRRTRRRCRSCTP